MCLAVILAAGEGRRAGGPKIVWPVLGTPSVRRVALAALGAAGVSGVLAVVGRWEAEAREALAGLDIGIVQNPDFAGGQSTSIKAAIREAGEAREAVFLLADQPYITSQIIDDLLQFHQREPGSISRPVYGSPVLFDLGRWRGALMELKGDRGGRAIMAAHPAEVNMWPAKGYEEKCFWDFDTREDYDKFI